MPSQTDIREKNDTAESDKVTGLLAVLQPLITPPRPLAPLPFNSYAHPRSITHPSVLTTVCLPHRDIDKFSQRRAQWKTETFKISRKPSFLSRTPQLGVSPPKKYIHRGSGNSTLNVRIFYRGIIFLRSIIRYDIDWSIA